MTIKAMKRHLAAIIEIAQESKDAYDLCGNSVRVTYYQSRIETLSYVLDLLNGSEKKKGGVKGDR